METFKLDNGIKVIFKKTETVGIASVKVYSPISVLHEDTSKAGVTALLYAVMNKSTANRNSLQLAEAIENLGSSISADVEYDFSGWTLNCMSDYFDKSCEVLADIILNPAFDEKEIKKERKLLIETIKSRKDNIKPAATDKFISDFYGKNHPYSVTRNGKEDTLKKLIKKDLQDVYGNIYSCKGIVITVVGNLKKGEVKKVLNKYFGKMVLSVDTPKLFPYKLPTFSGKDTVVTSKFNQAFIIYAYNAPDVLSKDFATLKMISSILGGRMTGRLFIELREKLGLAYEVSSVYPSRIANSYFEIYIGLDKKNIDVAKKGIEKIMADLCINKISKEELNDTKNFIKGVYLLDHQSVERQAYYMAFREMTGLGYKYDDEYIDVLSKISPEDILKTAKKYFKKTPYKLILKSK
ncbi:MAG: insulinase family protein [Elusimicrobia bacterium]|nr:insulinase family protein [Elusimicrobiota bacterium]